MGPSVRFPVPQNQRSARRRPQLLPEGGSDWQTTVHEPRASGLEQRAKLRGSGVRGHTRADAWFPWLENRDCTIAQGGQGEGWCRRRRDICSLSCGDPHGPVDTSRKCSRST